MGGVLHLLVKKDIFSTIMVGVGNFAFGGEL